MPKILFFLQHAGITQNINNCKKKTQLCKCTKNDKSQSFTLLLYLKIFNAENLDDLELKK